MKLVYVAGPYRGASQLDVDLNIASAVDRARQVWAAGHLPVTPHLMSVGFADDIVAAPGDEGRWMSGLLCLLAKCHEVWLVSGWETSAGTRTEIELAFFAGIPVILPDGSRLEQLPEAA